MKLIYVFVISLVSVISYGQTNTSTDKRDTLPDHRLSAVGVYLGINNTMVLRSGVEDLASTYQISPMFGAYGVFDINNKWKFETGLGGMIYNSKNLIFGSSYLIRYSKTDSANHYDDNQVTAAYYISVPVLFKYNFAKRSEATFGLRVSGEISYDIYTLLGDRTANYDQLTSFIAGGPVIPVNKFDIGLVVGYEYCFNEKLSISALVNVGFIPLIPKSYMYQWESMPSGNNTYYFSSTSGNYNNSLSIRLCYSFLKY